MPRVPQATIDAWKADGDSARGLLADYMEHLNDASAADFMFHPVALTELAEGWFTICGTDTNHDVLDEFFNIRWDGQSSGLAGEIGKKVFHKLLDGMKATPNG